MNVILNEILGVAFFAIAFVLLLLMFYAWGFPFDKARHRTAAPRWLIWAHRVLGYAYVIIFVYLMWQMVPRLWSYQIELPARTVAHLLLGMAIGAILIVKILIIRFFKHLEARLVPLLGTALFICTTLLMGLALPVALRESFLHDAAIMQGNVNDARLERVREMLPLAGLEDPKKLEELASAEGLIAGRTTLITKCVQCHDLRTILARPRTPKSWQQTVSRMANRATILNPISEDEQWAVTAYLIAISPTLQKSLASKRAMDNDAADSATAVNMASARTEKSSDATFDAATAKELVEQKCSQCHAHELVVASPPKSQDAAVALVTRMVSNGFTGSDEEIETIIRYLVQTYAAAQSSAASGSPDASPAPSATATESDAKSAQPSDGPFAQTIVISPAGDELRFAVNDFEAKVGQPLKIEFDNTSSMTHNLAVLAGPEALDAAISAALGAAAAGFLPQHEAVVSGIPATNGGQRQSFGIVFNKPGDYPFVCLMPGHGFTMRGTIRVVE
ncbi:MAG: hypothetical protein K0U93_03000 [Gammaproteobacteria bacterium]|nr:hypothetical protein [Gammaproteobacteria bacterium]